MHDELESSLFEPAVILPSQICVDAQWASDTSGPVALMLAVLEEAARGQCCAAAPCVPASQSLPIAPRRVIPAVT